MDDKGATMNTTHQHTGQNNNQQTRGYYGPQQPPPPHDGTRTGTQQDSNALLALALLLDFLPHEQAHKLHQRFASEVIYRLPQGRSPLFLSRHDIMAWVNAA